MRAVPSLAALAGLFAALSGCASTPKAPLVSEVERDSRAIAAFLAGRLAEGAQDPAAAAAQYRTAASYAPQVSALREQALLAALSAGDSIAAVEIAREGSGAGSSHWTRLTLAADALANHRPREARNQLADFAGDPAERIAATLIQAWSHAAQGRHELALATLDGSDFRLRAAGLDGLARDQQGLLLAHAERWAAAREAFDGAEPPLIRLAGVDVRRAAVAAELGQTKEAAAILSVRLQQSYDPRSEAALAQLQAGRAKFPRFDAQEGAALGIVSFAAALAGRQPADRYLPFLSLALLLAPDAEDLRLLQIEAQRALGRAEAARVNLQTIRPKSPFAGMADIQRAWLLHEAGAGAEAVQLARQAAGSGKRYAVLALADLLRVNERWAEAEAEYQRLFEGAEPADWRLYFLRGAARERLGRWPEAEADLRQALTLEPDQPDVLNYLGYGWVERGERLDEALAMLERAARLEPKAGHIIDSLGWAHFRLGDTDAALEHLERAAELSPDDPTVNDHLGDLYSSLGRVREARYQWERALFFVKEEALRARLRAKLDGSAPTEEPKP